MSAHSKGEVTTLLSKATSGDEKARERLFALVEHELRAISIAKLPRNRVDQALQNTVLIDDAFMRLVGKESQIDWQDRRHFYRAAAQAMRRIVIDQERARRAQRRGDGNQPIALESDIMGSDTPILDLLALDEALTKLSEFSPRQGKLVELHHFGGYTFEESARILGISKATAIADWKIAKAWLLRELTAE